MGILPIFLVWRRFSIWIDRCLMFQNASGDVEAAGWGNIFFHDANIKRFNGDPRLDIAALRPGTPVIMNGQQTQF